MCAKFDLHLYLTATDNLTTQKSFFFFSSKLSTLWNWEHTVPCMLRHWLWAFEPLGTVGEGHASGSWPQEPSPQQRWDSLSCGELSETEASPGPQWCSLHDTDGLYFLLWALSQLWAQQGRLYANAQPLRESLDFCPGMRSVWCEITRGLFYIGLIPESCEHCMLDVNHFENIFEKKCVCVVFMWREAICSVLWELQPGLRIFPIPEEPHDYYMTKWEISLQQGMPFRCWCWGTIVI